LTDLEGRFEVQSLPPSTYEIIVEEEPGYEPSRTSAQLTGSSSELVLYLRPSKFSETHRNDYTVSVRELKIPAKRGMIPKGVGPLA